MDDTYGLKINYPSITLYLNDKQILSSYYPKYIDTIVKHNEICIVPEGGIKTQPSVTLQNAFLYNTHTSLVPIVINIEDDTANDSMPHMDDSKSLADDIINGPNQNSFHNKFQHCTCHCQCNEICFCGTQFCSTVSKLQPPVGKPLEWFEQNLEAAVRARYAEIILYFHQQRGHPNFRHIINDFKAGVYDDDEYLSCDRSYMAKLRAMTSQVPPDSFICLTCPGYKIRKSKQIRQSNRVLSHPMAKGYIDAIGPFPIGYGDARYILVYRDEQSNYGFGSNPGG